MHKAQAQAGNVLRRRKRLAGGALRQAGRMVVALPQFGQLQVTAAGSHQGDAERQPVAIVAHDDASAADPLRGGRIVAADSA